MSSRRIFGVDEARRIGVDRRFAPLDVEHFRRGMDVELGHGLHDPATNVIERLEAEARREHGAG